MEIFKFKCENCGSNKLEKIGENTYMCAYCGNVEKIFPESVKQQTTAKAEEPKQKNTEEPQDDIEIKRVPHQEKVQHEEKNPQSKNNLMGTFIELIVCFFFGGLGVHKFMKGKIGLGILYLCTAGLFYVGWAVDTIICIYSFLREVAKSVGDKNG